MPRDSIDLADRLVVSALRLVRTLKQLRRSADLTEPEIAALAAITYSGGLAAKDLAAAEGVTPATISRLVSAMELKGLIRRSHDKADRRLQWIAATLEGARRVREGHAARLAPLAERLAKLPRAKRETLAAAATIIDEAVAEIARDAGG